MGDTQQDNAGSTTEQETPQEGAQEVTEQQPVDESTQTPEEPAEGTEEAPDEGGSTDDTEDAEDGDHDELPSWGRKQLTKARNDAANYRRRLAEANEQLAQATSPEEFETVKKNLAEATRRLDAERIANRHGLPEELREVLKGDTAEEIEAHAKTLAKFVQSAGPSIDDLSGGLRPGEEDGSLDPRTLASKHRRR